MANKIQSTLSSQYINDDTSELDYCINSALLDVNTWIPAEIVSESKTINNIAYYDVKPLLYDITTDDKPITNETIYNVPMSFTGNSNAYIKNKYKKGDKVKIDVCARDITLIKDTWKNGSPQGSGLFSFAGSVISGYLTVTEPKNYIDLTQDDMIFLKALKKFIVDAAEETDIESGKINLGKGILRGVLLEGDLTVIGGELILSGVATPTCTATITGGKLEVSGGSTTVKASS